jgi:copper chaperone CopZ
MQQIILDVPAMYGDHHVMRVRQVLLEAEGVKDVTASGARRKVAVQFDEKATSADAITKALLSAGYDPGEIPAPHIYPERHKDGSEWHSVSARITTTERKDREMAGDFRRY